MIVKKINIHILSRLFKKIYIIKLFSIDLGTEIERIEK